MGNWLNILPFFEIESNIVMTPWLAFQSRKGLTLKIGYNIFLLFKFLFHVEASSLKVLQRHDFLHFASYPETLIQVEEQSFFDLSLFKLW